MSWGLVVMLRYYSNGACSRKSLDLTLHNGIRCLLFVPRGVQSGPAAANRHMEFTDSNGEMKTTWTPGPQAGDQVLNLFIPGFSAIHYLATAR